MAGLKLQRNAAFEIPLGKWKVTVAPIFGIRDIVNVQKTGDADTAKRDDLFGQAAVENEFGIVGLDTRRRIPAVMPAS